MPKKKPRKSKAFYLDTNIAIDLATGRDIQTALLVERIKEKGWKCVSSTFLAMEMADFQQTYTYIAKEISKKRNPDDILRSKGSRRLNASDLHECEEWFEDFTKKFKHLGIYDFMNDVNAWTLAKEISFNSNLAAPDVIHLASAILASIGGYCDVLLTKDAQMRKEAIEILEKYKKFKKVKLKVMSVEEAKNKFFKS